MKTIVYDLSNHPEKKDHTQIYINNKKLNCFVVKKLEPQLNEKIEQTISRMDIKPSFDINEIQKRLAKGFFCGCNGRGQSYWLDKLSMVIFWAIIFYYLY